MALERAEVRTSLKIMVARTRSKSPGAKGKLCPTSRRTYSAPGIGRRLKATSCRAELPSHRRHSHRQDEAQRRARARPAFDLPPPWRGAQLMEYPCLGCPSRENSCIRLARGRSGSYEGATQPPIPSTEGCGWLL